MISIGTDIVNYHTLDGFASYQIGRKIRSWINPSKLDRPALEEAVSIAGHPKVETVVLMPDVHATGIGAPNGAVIVTENTFLPLAVGYDIGCGMAVVRTSYTANQARRHIASLMSTIQESVPAKDGKERLSWNGNIAERLYPPILGESRKDSERVLKELESANQTLLDSSLPHLEELAQQYPKWNAKRHINEWIKVSGQLRRHAGTLGSGNHFLEMQADKDGGTWLMVHSGSRGPGFKACSMILSLALAINEAENEGQKTGQQAWIDADSTLGGLYKRILTFYLNFARWNRESMLRNALSAIGDDDEVSADDIVDVPHNYAAQEIHEGHEVIVHRKGATSARNDEVVIIPGSMQTKSVLGIGLGSKASFQSCSHGAGRVMSRSAAKSRFANEIKRGQTTIPGPDGEPVYLARPLGSKPVDELGAAYKPLEDVIAAQEGELIHVTHRLTPLGVLKA